MAENKISPLKTSQKIYLPFKRMIDIFGSLLGIIFCASLLWWWVFFIDLIVFQSFPIYIAKRYSKNKKVFSMIKFKTYAKDAPEIPPYSLTNKEQLTKYSRPFGSFLRKTSIDETPQLINILFGQMSFVGPRPGSIVNEEDLVKEREKYQPSAYFVRPGLTGLAQIKMNRGHDIQIKAAFDNEYVKNISFICDFKIVILTIAKLFSSMKGE